MTPDRNPVLAASCRLAALLVTFLAACGSTPDKAHCDCDASGKTKPTDWVAIGDLVQVTDSLHSDEIAADVIVDIDGTVVLPEIGTVQVAGRTASEIRDLLVARYCPYHEVLDLHVEIRTGCKKYFVVGDVGHESVNLIRADPRDPRVLIIDRSEFIDMRGSKDEVDPNRDSMRDPAIPAPEYAPVPAPEPRCVPDDGSIIFLTLGEGRAR